MPWILDPPEICQGLQVWEVWRESLLEMDQADAGVIEQIIEADRVIALIRRLDAGQGLPDAQPAPP